MKKNVFAVGQDNKLIEQFPSSQEQANWVNKLRTNKNILPYIVRPDGTGNITKRVVNWYRYGILFNKDPQKKHDFLRTILPFYKIGEIKHY